MVGAGVHINAIGGDCPGKTELHGDICADRTCSGTHPSDPVEGEIQQMPAIFPRRSWAAMSALARRSV
ncbi:hypothetical protein [Paracoccus mutanolyticus]|uniref:hypothetical protein n=1 Tax=Paracoccus mutanolyticus TaxID=1499308 RepID=UPI0011AE67FC|nr:hypothetical protein [Paracoccus mutanolyticus]